MASNLPSFTIRIESEFLKKVRYIAEYNARSANREIELLIKAHIKRFESKHGEITEKDMSFIKENKNNLHLK